MKRKITALILILAMAMTGCCYAPGNERASFEEKWLSLPEMKMDDYQSTKDQVQSENQDAVEPTEGGTALEDPVVNLEDMPKREPADFVGQGLYPGYRCGSEIFHQPEFYRQRCL